MESMAILVVVTIIFIIATAYLGWYGHKHTKNNEEYLLGRSKARPAIVALSYGATFLSTSAIVGFGGMAANYGLIMIWLMVLCILVGTIIAFTVFGKRTRRKGQALGVRTFPELLGKIFVSPSIRTFSAMMILIGMPVYCAAVLTGGVNFIAVTIGVNRDIVLLGLSLIVALYVIYGGVIAVMYNDALQAAIMFAGMVFILVFTFWKLGGVGEAFASLKGLWATGVNQGDFAGMVGNGFRGWSDSPAFGSNIWLTVVTTLLLGVGIGALAQPQLVVRFLSAKSDKALDRSMWIGAAFVLVILGAAFTLGPLSNVFFFETTGRTAAQLYPNTDMIIPGFVNALFANMAGGDLFISLFVLALICAAISTMSALFHVMGSAAGYDIWTRRKNLREVSSPTSMAGSMKANRVGTMIMVVVVVVVAYLMPINIIAKATVIFMGMTAAALLPTMAYGLYAKGKPNALVAKISIAAGVISWSIWAFFVNKGIADILGIPRIVNNSLIYVDPLIIGLPMSTLALIVAYFLIVRMKGTRSAQPQ
ncbi:MAG: sodium:solute symporter family protein [Methanomassiliicoccaceae archaeon]|jgi:SSS family solute:Na+ symporter|nr:sodium:solute symporter family protein [Methanomassiliicoccaceae archaeon]